MKYRCTCFCKAVCFEVTLKSFELTICHCQMCRKLNSSTGFASIECGSSVIFNSIDNLVILTSSAEGERGFCNLCGTSLFFKFKKTNEYFVPPAIIEKLPESEVVFSEEIFYDNKPCYYSYSNKTTKRLESEFI
ncbi:GFA family protein [Vagococcus sp. BWB3-3]|uniref:GFA family protein n=1 Tax=Vagococcus allomyrinae TaxID=2794353 RepID=A0A940SUG1_9ENTE|nr:GFA family protein [Vagococcus allomyrinae]MBP1044277.1 GFA family protein [Vagococcus allomyrinae]